MQKLDEDLEAGTSEDDQLSPAREINLVVSQIIFELSQIYERNLQCQKGIVIQLKKDVGVKKEMFEEQKNEVKALKSANVNHKNNIDNLKIEK